jgi:predicted ribosome quality control (RQC) complex YloA/Tae2 family protein
VTDPRRGPSDGNPFEERRAEIAKRLRSEGRRLERKRRAIEADLARAETAPTLRHEADLLLANLHLAPKKAREIEVADWLANGAPRRIPLDPAKPVKDQPEARYRRARRYERGIRVAKERLRACEEALEDNARARARCEVATTEDDLDTLSTSLPTRTPPKTGSRKADEARKPYRVYTTEAGRRILVGRGAADNDDLTLHHAKMHDLWLHTRETTGAHVVVPLSRGEICPPDLLVDAATLAAHFSEARGEETIDVIYVARRYVRKPRKSPPGLVRVEREKVIAVKMEPTRLARLLASGDRV